MLFCFGQKNQMRILALDVGEKRIGTAISDPLGITANGLSTIERVGVRKDCDAIIALIDEYDCEKVVIGLPLMLDGSSSPQTDKVREFARILKNKLKSTGRHTIKLVYYDERFTTAIAERVLIDADVSRKKRKDVIDKQAAIIILTDYLSSKLPEMTVE